MCVCSCFLGGILAVLTQTSDTDVVLGYNEKIDIETEMDDINTDKQDFIGDKILIDSISFKDDKITLVPNKTISLNKYLNIFPSNATNKNIIWVSSNEEYATVLRNGDVIAKEAGNGKSVIIKAKTADGSGLEVSREFYIGKYIKKIEINSQYNTIAINEKVKLDLKVSPKNATNKEVKWVSSNEEYATVNKKGVVIAKEAGKNKSVTIKAVAKDGSLVVGEIELQINSIDVNKSMVALTFDDGPSKYTTRILECLKKYDSKATFFEVGVQVKKYPEITKNVFDDGHELANHTYEHVQLTKVSGSEMKSQVEKTNDLIEENTGERTKLVRPPYGSYDNNVKQNLDYPLILWSIDTLDWKTKDANATYNSVINGVKDGSIVLMHDFYSTTADAVEKIVPKLVKEGFQLVTVSDMYRYKGVKLESGHNYSQILN